MRNWLIIGSVATYHWFPDARQPSDIDLLTPATISGNSTNICIVDTQWHSAAQELINANSDPVFADADLLYTLKVSHAEYDIKWDKTMFDVKFLADHGCKILEPQFTLLCQVWKEIHKQKKVNLKQSVDEFFKDAVNRIYDHEQLHELIAFNDRPMHETIRKDSNSVWVSKELFFELPEEQQIQTALEEILVTAIERGKLSSSSSQIDILRAVHKATKTLITSMTTGWFARFLIQNHYKLLYENKQLWKTQLYSALMNLQHLTRL